MFNRARRWLLHRRKPTSSGIGRGLSAYLSTSWRRESVFEQDMAEDPGMCAPMTSKPTRHITRMLEDQDETVIDDMAETRTMETVLVGR